jgi:hypothetical protein
MKTTFYLTLCLLGSICTGPLLAGDLDPFLRVRETVRVEAAPPVAVDEQSDKDVFVTRGGTTTIVRVFRIFDFNPRIVHQLARGIGSPADLDSFKRVLAAGRVGVQEDCNIDSAAIPLNTWEFTWYGKNNRRNSFVVAIGPSEVARLPPCPPVAFAMVNAFLDYELAVLDDPSTELLTNE